MAAAASSRETSNAFKVHQGDSLKVLKGWCRLKVADRPVFDGVLTSPPYNACDSTSGFYTTCEDNMLPDDYVKWLTEYFVCFDKLTQPHAVVCMNLSYFHKNPGLPTAVLCSIAANTKWKLLETIAWKKPQAHPGVNNLARTVESVYVFTRDVNNYIKRGDMYSFTNFIEAPGKSRQRQEQAKKSKCMTTALFSIQLVEELIKRYYPEDANLLDPFLGTGTTGEAALAMGLRGTGIELDKDCAAFAGSQMTRFAEEHARGTQDVSADAAVPSASKAIGKKRKTAQAAGVDESTDGHYTVESILDAAPSSSSSNQMMYRIKWKGYPTSQSTWESDESLMESGDINVWRMMLKFNKPNN